MIAPSDELLHEVGASPHWQESFYFNWFDTTHQLFGLARIGLRFNRDRMDGLVLAIRGDRPTFLYPATPAHHGPWTDQDPSRELRTRGLTMTMEEPLQRWRIRLQGRHSLELVFEANSPPFDYRDEGRHIADDMTGHHFEQCGRVTGWIDLKGTRLEIDGLGQRDKSWGVRDWGGLSGWNWITAHFDGGFGFNATQTFQGNKAFDNGFVQRDGANHAIRTLEVTHEWGRRAHVPERTRMNITDAGGAQHAITATALGHFPLVNPGGAWIQETSARFVCRTDGGEAKNGHGVIEHVWRPTLPQFAARFPGLLSTIVRVLR